MKQGWEIKKLGDITTSINGLWTGKKPPFTTIAVIRNTNFTKDCKLDTSDIAYIDVEVKQYASRKLQCGDIIIEKSGGSDKQPVGRPILFNIEEGEYSFSNFTSTLRVRDKTTILPEFIHRYLAYIYMRGDTAAMQSKTTGIRNLDFNLYKSINIPVPSIEEQERIVEELDCLSGVIERKREQLRELDALAQSIFYQMFGDPITNEKGWDVKKLEELCDIINGFAFPSSDFAESNPIKVIKITNVGVNEFISDDSSLPEEYNNMEGCKVHTGDIVIALTRTIISTGVKRAIVPNEYNESLVNQRVAAILANDRIVSRRFLYSYLGTDFVRQYILQKATALMQPNLSIRDLRDMPTIYPPLASQQEFAEKIEAIEKQKELIKQSITQTEELFNSRMDYYFN